MKKHNNYQFFYFLSWRFIFFSILLTFSKCGSPDYYEELSGNYFFRGGDGDGIVSHQPNRKNIYGKVVRYKFNNDFIVALQTPDYKDYQSMVSFELGGDVKKYSENSDEDMNLTDKIADSILHNDPYYKKVFSSKENYWIISHKNECIYGPLTRSEYKEKRAELKVPNSLQLD